MKLKPKDITEFKEEIVQYRKVASETHDECRNIDEDQLRMYYLFKLNKYSDILGKLTMALIILTSVLLIFTLVLVCVSIN